MVITTSEGEEWTSKLFDEANEMNEQFKDVRAQRDSAQKIIAEQEQIRDSAQEVLDKISKPNMTDEDIKIMKDIQANNPELFEKIWPRLEYGLDYIQINLPNSGKIQIDRQDLGAMDWDTAQEKSSELGKTLLKKKEYTELREYIGPKETKSIFDFNTHSYWSSTERGTNYAWFDYFSYGSQDYSYSKNKAYYVRCVRKA